MNHLLIIPVILPLFSAILMLFFKNRSIQRVINVIAAFALFSVSLLLLFEVKENGIIVTQLGNWPAPFGITLVADMLSIIMVTVSAFVAFNIALYSLAGIDKNRESFGYYPLLHILFMGVNGAFLTGDLFNLYVWFEVMLMSSFVLMALGGERRQMEGAVKYVTINFISSVFFLAGLGLLYGNIGSLNMADLAVKMQSTSNSQLIMASSMLLLVAFGIKAALFPLYFWLPASYHVPPIVVSAVFAGLLTKVGVYTLIRVYTLIFIQDTGYITTIFLILSAFTMVSGVLGAAVQFEFRKILSFHIISQIGYMTLGLALFTPLALAAAVFYLFHHIIVKTNLFLISGITHYIKGHNDLKKSGGLYKSYPFLALLILIPALSLGGIPQLSGFFAKFSIIKAGIINEEYFVVFIALAVSVLTLYSMTKIWAEVFWKKDPSPEIVESKKTIPVLLILPVIIMALATIVIGFYPQPFIEISNLAGEQLMDPQRYIKAVMGILK